MIQITQLGDATKHATFLIYGESGAGKTWLAKTLPVSEDSKLLYVAADPGDLTLRDRPKFSRAQAPNGVWTREYLNELYEYILNNNNLFEWIFIDGIDDLGEAILSAEKRKTTNLQRAYGEMADFMKEWVLRMRDIPGTNVVLTTHIESEKDDLNQFSFFPSFPGQSFKKRVKDYFDFVGCVRWVTTESGRERMIQFSQEADARYQAKERGGVVTPLEKPDLGAILNRLQAAGFRAIDPSPKRSRAELKPMNDLMKTKGVSLDTMLVKFGGHPKNYDENLFKQAMEYLNSL